MTSTVTLHKGTLFTDVYGTIVEDDVIVILNNGEYDSIMMQDGYEKPTNLDFMVEDNHFASFNTKDAENLTHELYCNHKKVWKWVN